MPKQPITLFIFSLVFLMLPNPIFAVDKLLQQSDLEYIGAFRMPVDPIHGGTLWYTDYPGKGLAFRPPTSEYPSGSLFIAGHNYYDQVAEISIPSTIVSSSDVSTLARSELIQPFTDILGAKVNCIYTDNSCISANTLIGGLLVYNNQLIGTLYDYYSHAPDQERSHFSAPLTLSENSASGIYQPVAMARLIAGHMATVPNAYQAALGGPALTGLHDVPIITATSYSLTAFSFDPDDLDMNTPFAITPLMYVNGEPHTTYGYWMGSGPANPVVASTDAHGGLVFPDGSQTVLFIGRHGDGLQCYGENTDDIAKHGLPLCGGETCCYDLEDSAKGQHAYPYVYQVWAYDVDDLIAVKNGTKAHNSVEPYAYWHLNFPNIARDHDIMGVAYDSTTQRVYVSQNNADGTSPLIQVFHVNLSETSDSTPPNAPIGLNVL